MPILSFCLFCPASISTFLASIHFIVRWIILIGFFSLLRDVFQLIRKAYFCLVIEITLLYLCLMTFEVTFSLIWSEIHQLIFVYWQRELMDFIWVILFFWLILPTVTSFLEQFILSSIFSIAFAWLFEILTIITPFLCAQCDQDAVLCHHFCFGMINYRLKSCFNEFLSWISPFLDLEVTLSVSFIMSLYFWRFYYQTILIFSWFL